MLSQHPGQQLYFRSSHPTTIAQPWSGCLKTARIPQIEMVYHRFSLLRSPFVGYPIVRHNIPGLLVYCYYYSYYVYCYYHSLLFQLISTSFVD